MVGVVLVWNLALCSSNESKTKVRTTLYGHQTRSIQAVRAAKARQRSEKHCMGIKQDHIQAVRARARQRSEQHCMGIKQDHIQSVRVARARQRSEQHCMGIKQGHLWSVAAARLRQRSALVAVCCGDVVYKLLL